VSSPYSYIKTSSHYYIALYDFSPNHPIAPLSSPSPPTIIPLLVYRVHRASAQTRYAFGTGFSSKNQTTIVNYTSGLSRFGVAHLHRQTNISSPFISVYDTLSHAESVAKQFSQKYGEDTFVVTIDTRHLARGPVFRAADLLKDTDDSKSGDKDLVMENWLHWGEYLVMYRIPAQAIRDQTPVERTHKWGAVGVIGGA
jgi:hypothetical protein